MHEHLLRRALPFTLALVVGVAAASVMRRERLTHPCSVAPRSAPVGVLDVKLPAAAPRGLPEVHVLSPMDMDEVQVFELSGGGYTSARVISPPGPHYEAPPRRSYEQGVLQLSFYFGADGTISEIEPPFKPHDCSICLQGKNVTYINPRDPASREYVEAAEEAVRRIKFEPGTLGGQPVGMHGLAECIFRLDGEQTSKRDE
ncbi:MAG: hypothetical protein LC746_16810 [Acidobacteria bacterium]|nr:hypothetical protein [Acidobacteriota bacterium]